MFYNGCRIQNFNFVCLHAESLILRSKLLTTVKLIEAHTDKLHLHCILQVVEYLFLSIVSHVKVGMLFDCEHVQILRWCWKHSSDETQRGRKSFLSHLITEILENLCKSRMIRILLVTTYIVSLLYSYQKVHIMSAP
jgi:hypothetical protein